MDNRSKLKLRNLVILVTSKERIMLQHEWTCNKCFKVFSSYESVRIHKQEMHAY